jgi:enoyl-CoA hydratase/carnithine racemase
LPILIEGNGSTKIDSVLDRPKKMEALTDPSHDQLIAALPHASGSDWLPHP